MGFYSNTITSDWLLKEMYSSSDDIEKNVFNSTRFKSGLYSLIKAIIDDELDLLDRNVINEDISKKIKEISDKKTIDLLEKKVFIPEFSFHAPIRVDTIVDRERSENLNFFRENKKLIDERFDGKYIIIANKSIVTSGDSWDEIKDKDTTSNHRFILKIESETVEE
jgi:hypothetical protein